MRQIKFRAWDKLNKNWFNPSNTNDGAGLTFDGEIAFCSQSQFGHIDPKNKDRFIVQQFTGLLDKNGREIYEGDILKIEEWDRDDLIAKVIFCERNVGFRVATGSGVVYENFPSSRYLQVIGNIFETPELCKI